MDPTILELHRLAEEALHARKRATALTCRLAANDHPDWRTAHRLRHQFSEHVRDIAEALDVEVPEGF